MKKFACPKCEKTFSQQVTLDYHLKKKNPCDKFLKKSEITNDDKKEQIDAKKMREYLDELKCVYCNKEFARKNNVLYHIEHNCKKVKEIEEEKHKIFLKLKEEAERKIKLQEEENNKFKLLEIEISKLKDALENKEKKLEKKYEKKLIKEISKIKKSITNVSHNNSHNNASNSHNNIDNSINDSNIQQQNIFLANYTGSGMPPIPDDEILPLLKRGFQTSFLRARNKIIDDL
jgi:hypothetical protein